MSPQKTKEKNPEVNDITKEIFLDNEGKNVDILISELTKALKSFKIWWEHGNPNPSINEIEEKREKISKYLEENPFRESYSVLKDFILRTLAMKRFNTRNYVNIHPTPVLPSTIGILYITLQNPNNIVIDVSKNTTMMEKECVRFMAEKLVGFDAKYNPSGNLVADGTLANITALLIARDKIYNKLHEPLSIWQKTISTWTGDFGLYREKAPVIISTKNDHYSIRKALWILGVGSRNYIRLPVAYDAESIKKGEVSYSEAEELQKFENGEPYPFSLQPIEEKYFSVIESALENNIPILSIVQTFGATETGTLESPKITSKIRKEYGEDIWIHIDAAIGGFALTVEEVKERSKGIEFANSVTIDPHKWAYMPYPNGAIIFRKISDHNILHHSAPYLVGLAPTIEGSRPGTHAAALWIAIKTLGISGWRKIIETRIKLARYFGKLLADDPLFQPLHTIDLNTVCFTLRKEGETREQINYWINELVKRINTEGHFYINKVEELAGIKVRNNPLSGFDETKFVDIHGVRLLIMHPYTTEEDVEKLYEEIRLRTKKIVW